MFLGKQLPRGQEAATGGAGLALPPWKSQPSCRRENVCGRRRPGLCLLPCAVWLSQSKTPLLHHRESFHFLSPWPVPGPGPQVGGRKFFRPPHTSRHTPLAAIQPPCAGRPAVLFHAFSTKRLCFFTLGTSQHRRRAWGWAGGCLAAHWLRRSDSFFPTLFGGPLCVSSL